MFAATVVFFRNCSEDFSAEAFPQRIRSRTHFPAEGYRPHFAPKGSREMLGIVFAAFEHTRFGESLQAGLEYLYPRPRGLFRPTPRHGILDYGRWHRRGRRRDHCQRPAARQAGYLKT